MQTMSILEHSVKPAKLFVSSKENVDLLELPTQHVSLPLSKAEGYLLNIENLDDENHSRIQSSVRQHALENHNFSFGFLPDKLNFKAAFFDMDATVVEEETIVELARFAKKSDLVEQITEKAMRGEIDFDQALIERVAVLDGLSTKIFDDVYSAFTLQPNIKELISTLKESKCDSYLVSGGFIQLADKIAVKVGIIDAHANLLQVEKNVLTGRVEGQIVGANEKKEYLHDVCSRNNIQICETIAIGDGANDLDMMKSAMLSVGFCPKPILVEHVDILNRFKDHLFLVDLLNL